MPERKFSEPINAGYYYYRKEHGYGIDLPDCSMSFLLGNNNSLTDVRMNEIPYPDYFQIQGADSFPLRTHYPGLIIGIGYVHAVEPKEKEEQKSNKNQKEDRPSEFQQGFFFDWTTGIPVIPGASIKGVIRSIFPKKSDNNSIIDEKCAYFQEHLKIDIETNQVKPLLKKLESSIFEEKGDIFYDAYIQSPNKQGRIFAEDYIAYHEDPFKDPKPIRFLKIETGVTFCFQFKLKSNDRMPVSPKQKCDLFKQIILDFGLGAKTNSGYGIFQEIKEKKRKKK